MLIIYNSAWLQIEIAAEATANGRKLYRTPVRCHRADHEVAEAARKVFKYHI